MNIIFAFFFKKAVAFAFFPGYVLVIFFVIFLNKSKAAH